MLVPVDGHVAAVGGDLGAQGDLVVDPHLADDPAGLDQELRDAEDLDRRVGQRAEVGGAVVVAR